MKGVAITEHGGPEVLQYGDWSDPQPGEGEALIRVRACALNHLDLWLRRGIPAYRLSLPHIPGSDVAGEILSLPDDKGPFQIGQKVIVNPNLTCGSCRACRDGEDSQCDSFGIFGAKTWGGYAELARVPVRNLIPMPENLTFEEAAAFPLTFLTAWHMLHSRGRIRAGEWVLVWAAGSGVGSAAVQIAKLSGALVIATVGSEQKVEKAQTLGADFTLLHSREDVVQQVRAITEGRGVDLVVDHIGQQTMPQSLQVLAKGGRIVTCGATTGPSATFDIRFLFSRQLSIIGSMMGRTSELMTIVDLVGQRKLKPVLSDVLPLQQAAQAHRLMESRSFFGKLVLVVESD
ncbi:MAG: zinc-binding dehydrogenase [Armatimonadetes bacterium]|nr:zinc-binding dehydrogenase [Armatimonadota bacterium]MDW8121276.1 zinc-binding dehydrogenase [Armatimonadota bacterium]